MSVSSVDDAAPYYPDIKINITPHNPPVAIPVSGGNVDFTLAVTNIGAGDESFDVWTEYAPVGALGPFHFLLPGKWSTERSLSHPIPGALPAGQYTYTAYVGFYPNSIWDSESFPFKKMPSAGWYEQNSGTTDFIYDVDFPATDQGWAVGLNSILHTTDGGDNWYPQASPTYYNYFDVDFIDAQEGWIAGGFTTILHTTDGGEHWLEQDIGNTQYHRKRFLLQQRPGLGHGMGRNDYTH